MHDLSCSIPECPSKKCGGNKMSEHSDLKDFDWEVYRVDDYSEGKLVETSFGLKAEPYKHNSYVSIQNMAELADTMIGIAYHRIGDINVDDVYNPKFSNFRGWEVSASSGMLRVQRGLDNSELEKLAIELSRSQNGDTVLKLFVKG